MSIAIGKGITPSGQLVTIAVDQDGKLLVVGGTGGSTGGGGDASAANQTTQITRLIEIRDRLDNLNLNTDGIEALIGTLNSYVDGLEALQTATNSTQSAISGFVDQLEGYTDGIEGNQLAEIAQLETIAATPARIGNTTDTSATSDTGTFSLISLLKRLLSTKLPSALAVDRLKVEAVVVIASRTTSFINTTTTGTIAAGANSVAVANIGSAAGIVKGASLPAGASISWAANNRDTLDALAYSATGTNFLITTVT